MQPLLHRITIRQKLCGLGAVSVVIFVILASLATLRMGSMQTHAREVSQAHELEKTVTAAYEGWLLDDDQSNMYAAVVALRDPSQHALAETTYAQAVDGYTRASDALKKATGLATNADERARIDHITTTLAAYNAFGDEMRKRSLAGDVQGAIHVMTVENLAPSNELPTAFEALRQLEVTTSAHLQSKLSAEAGAGRTQIMLTALLGLLIIVGALWALVRAISRPLGSVVDVLEAVASGDLSRRLKHDNEDEIGRIAVALNSAVESLETANADAARAGAERDAMAEQERTAAVARVEAEAAAARAESERDRLEAADKAEQERRTLAEQVLRQQEQTDREHEEDERRRAEVERERLAKDAEAAREQERVEEQRRRELDLAQAKAAEAAELAAKVDSLLAVVNAAAEGDLTRQVEVFGADTVGQLGAGLDRLLTTLRSSIAEIASNAATLSSASEELTVTAAAMDDSVQETALQATEASTVAQQVSANVEEVANGADNLTSAMQEIARSAGEAATVAGKAVEVAGTTTSRVARLGTSSAEINEVVDLITGIASQTNLLALNATIEAARAGEAGKGFAVVASEVKDLANQTAKATNGIRGRIEAIQVDTTGAIEAIGEISDIIDRISALQNSIAAAVEEQATITKEMSRSVAEAATGTATMTSNAARVAGVAEANAVGAAESKRAADGLTRMAADLKGLVSQFRYTQATQATQATVPQQRHSSPGVPSRAS